MFSNYRLKQVPKYINTISYFSDIQGLLSTVIKELLPLDITKAMPKTIIGVSELLKGREAHHFTGSLNTDAGKREMLKTIQNMKR